MSFRRVKALLVDAVVFLSFITLVGHLGLDIWQRYVVNFEIDNMKANLYSLKNTLDNILTAYDKLDNELNSLKTNERAVSSREFYKLHTGGHRDKNALKDRKKIAKATKDKACSIRKQGVRTVNFAKINGTTIIKYPLQSTAMHSRNDTRRVPRYNFYSNTYECDEHDCSMWKF
nr:uncharacterized protein LOC128673630 [Plodia interpunctella]